MAGREAMGSASLLGIWAHGKRHLDGTLRTVLLNRNSIHIIISITQVKYILICMRLCLG